MFQKRIAKSDTICINPHCKRLISAGEPIYIYTTRFKPSVIIVGNYCRQCFIDMMQLCENESVINEVKQHA